MVVGGDAVREEKGGEARIEGFLRPTEVVEAE